MKTSTRIISHELFLMSRHPISDFVLLITTSNVVWWNKNVKTTLQEVTGEKVSCRFRLQLYTMR
jgi:hypothetical protein